LTRENGDLRDLPQRGEGQRPSLGRPGRERLKDGQVELAHAQGAERGGDAREAPGRPDSSQRPESEGTFLMRSSHSLEAMAVTFDYEHAVANAEWS
jgi:hypothetical protein